MALSKTISDRGSHGHHTFTLTVTETAVNKSANTSTCSIKFTISQYQPGYNWEDFTGSEKPKGTVTFNGTSYSWDLPNYNGKSTVTLVSKTGITVKHGSDGKKTVRFSFSCSSGSTSYLPGSASASGSLALTSIARTPTVTQKVSSKTETSITMTWSSDLVIDTIRYSKDGGSTWTSKNVSDGKTGSYTVSGLSANTSYSMKTELHSKESGLSGQSSALSVKTYNWPYASISDFNIIDGMKVTIVNPLEHTVTLKIYAQDTLIARWEGAYTYDFGRQFESDFLALIETSMTGSWYCTVEYGGHTTTSATKTFSAAGYNPTVNVVRYADTNTTAQAIIQDNATILQNVSTPRFTISGTGQFGATIVGGSVHIIGTVSGTAADNVVTVDYGTIDSAADIAATATIIDSRGNSASKTIVVTMAAYTMPSAIINLNRKNNFYSLTDIKVDASVMPLGTNVATITARWKVTGTETWSASQTIPENTTTALNGSTGLDNTKAWDVQVTVTDSFGGTRIYNTGVGVGLPIAFFDRLLRAMSINSFPKEGQPLVVDGVDILGELFYKPGDKLSIDGTGTGGAPFTGYVTATNTTIRFMVPVGKSLANITTITCTTCTGGIRGIGGYVDGSRDNTDWVSGYTITCTKPTDHIVQVQIQKSSAFSGSTNNTPIAYAAANFELEFN